MSQKYTLSNGSLVQKVNKIRKSYKLHLEIIKFNIVGQKKCLIKPICAEM